MMENEPPEHTRLRRPVAGGVRRGHVERLRPRVRELAAELLDEVDPDGFDVIADYAEPLPVLVIAELLGVPALARAATCATGRRRSCGCTRSAPAPADGRRRGARRRRVRRRWSASWSRERRAAPGRRPGHRPGRPTASWLPRTRWWRRSCCCSTPATRRRSTSSATGWSRCCARGLRPGPDVAARLRRGDAALRLGAAALRAHRHRGRRRSATSTVEAGREDRRAARRGQPRPGGVRPTPDEFDVDRDPNPHLAFGVGRALLPRRAAGPDGAGRVAARCCSTGSPPGAGRRAGAPRHVRAARATAAVPVER